MEVVLEGALFLPPDEIETNQKGHPPMMGGGVEYGSCTSMNFDIPEYNIFAVTLYFIQALPG